MPASTTENRILLLSSCHLELVILENSQFFACYLDREVCILATFWRFFCYIGYLVMSAIDNCGVVGDFCKGLRQMQLHLPLVCKQTNFCGNQYIILIIGGKFPPHFSCH